nr:MAG TPA: hypothetical protein [Caudoviricetes sp.]
MGCSRHDRLRNLHSRNHNLLVSLRDLQKGS